MYVDTCYNTILRGGWIADPNIDQQYLPLLKLADHQPRNEDDAPAQAIRESDLLPDSTKLTMVMEAAGDIKHAERVLRDIELLKKQEVEGSGQLHGRSYSPPRHTAERLSPCSDVLTVTNLELLPYRGQLISGIQEEKENSVDLRNTRKEVNELLRRYNDFVSYHPTPEFILPYCPKRDTHTE